MTKRILSLILALVFCFGCLPLQAMAEDIEIVGPESEDGFIPVEEDGLAQEHAAETEDDIIVVEEALPEEPAAEPVPVEPEAGGGGSQSVTITFDPNGGEGWTNRLYYTYGDEVYAPECGFTRSYYNFIGWGVDPEGPVLFLPGGRLDISESMTFYAIWQPMSREELNELYAPKNVELWRTGFSVDHETGAITMRAELHWTKNSELSEFAVSLNLGAPDGPTVPGTTALSGDDLEVYYSTSCYAWVEAPFLDEGVEQTVTDGTVNGLLNGDIVYATISAPVADTLCPGNPVAFTAEKPGTQPVGGDDPLKWFVTSGSGNVEYNDYGVATVTLVNDTVLPEGGLALEEGSMVHIAMNTHTLSGTLIQGFGTELYIEHLTASGPVLALYSYAGVDLSFSAYGYFNSAAWGSVTATFTDKGSLAYDPSLMDLTAVNGAVVTSYPYTLENFRDWGYENTTEPITLEIAPLSEEELAQHIPQNVEVTPLEGSLAVSWDTDPDASEAEIYVDVLMADNTVAKLVGGYTVCAPGQGPESACWLESGGFNYATISITTLSVDEEQIYTDGYVNGVLPNQTLIVTVTHLVGPHWQETPKSDPVSFVYTASNFGRTFDKTGPVERTCLADGGVLTVTSPLEGLVYNGQGQTLDYTVSYNGQELVKGVDYVGRYTGYYGPGTATLAVVALRPWSGALSQSYTIAPIDLESEALTVEWPAMVYNESYQYPEPVITCGGYTLSRSSDYNVSYTDNRYAGEATATITPGYRNTAVGTRVETFIIAPRSLTSPSAKLMLTELRCAWTGEPVTPGVTVKWGTKTLTQGTDYTVIFENNIDPGTATAVVTGIGNYGDERRLSFEIFERSDLAAAVIDPIGDQAYTGGALTPEVTVRLGEKVLRRGLDYGVSYENNVSVGVATVTVTGNGAYQGSVTGSFHIIGKSIEDYNISLSKTEYTYNGSPFEPTVSVYDDDWWYLTRNRDYTVSYENNIYPGTATVTVTGIGDYSGTKTAEFTINKLDLNDIYSCSVDSCVYTTKPQTPFIRLSLDGWTYLVEGTDYEILGWANNVEAGDNTASVTVRGLGCYTGERTIAFSINPMPMYANDFTVDYEKNVTYTGQPLNPIRSIVWKLTGQTLVEGRDYTIEYYSYNDVPDNENNDNHTDIQNGVEVRLIFTGNFSGSGYYYYFNIVEPLDESVLPLGGSYSGMAWSIDEEGTLWVAGMADLSYHDDAAFRPYRQYIKKIVLSSTSTIYAGTFQDCPYVTEVVLPDGLTSISYNVFSGCDSLKKINIPDSVTMVAGSAFPRVQGLEIHLPDNITDFDGNYAFDNISSSTKVFVRRGSASAQKLIDTNGYFFYEGYPDFQLMKSLNTPALGLQLYRYFGSGGTVTIPDFVDSMPYAYGLSSTYCVEKVIIPANVGNLGWGGSTPFTNSYGLREIVIEPGDKLTELPSQFISGCDNITLYLPDNITSIGTLNYYTYSNMLIVANCNSYAIEWAKSQTSWGSPVWYDESEAQTGPRYRMIHDLVHHAGTPATCETDGCADWDTCRHCDYTNYTVLPAFGHDWGEPAYVWADDHSALTATRVCLNDASHVETETVGATSEITLAPTCETAGETTYRSAAFENPAFEAQVLVLADIPALGHDWGEPVWSWTGLSAASATFTCSTDPSHVETVEAVITVEMTPAVCEAEGRIVYTATVTHAGGTFTDEKTEVIPALGHDWGEPTYVWADDNSAVTATRVCGNDSAHVESETVNTASEVTKSATCTEPGETTYTAVFENPAFAAQTKTVADIPAAGHTPGEPVEENRVEPTCTEPGGYDSVVYCTVCGEELSRERVVLPALGHDWGEPTYVWADDNSAVTATRVCLRDENHVESETANTASEVTKSATCTEPGETTYTAVFENPAFATQTKTVADIPATGHTPGEPVEENRVEPTCTEPGGYDLVVYCTVCGEELSREHVVLPALGHDWGAPSYVWADDNSAVTATAVCIRDASHKLVEHAATSYEVIVEPTVESEGLGRYTATFVNECFTAQTKDVVLDKLTGFPVTVDLDRTPGGVTVSIEDGGLYSGETAFTVESEDDRAVIVAVKTADGYEALVCSTDENGVHHFSLTVTEETELAFIYRGDANGDGRVNMRDSLSIKKHSAGTALLEDLLLLAANADGDTSGRVTMRDSLAVKRDSAGTTPIGW